jgi:type IV secretory pathway VirJ component
LRLGIRSLLALLALLALVVLACAAGANAAAMLAHGRFTQVAVYRPAREVKQFVLLLSGQGGGKVNLAEAAQALANEGAMVAIVNTPELLGSLERDAASCTSPDGDLENLSRYVQAYYRLPTYITPILIGYAEGATFAYAMISQAPPDLFAGAVSLQFCRTLPLKRPLCPSATLESTPAGEGIQLAPATRVQVPWIALQIEGSGACAAPLTPEFVAQVPHAQEIVIPAHGSAWTTTASWLPQFLSAYRKIAAQRVPEPPPPASLSDLPIIEEPARGNNDLFAVFLSGDGGWAGIDKNVAASLIARGISVAGVDSLRYFWEARTPQGLADDMDRILRYYAFHWKKKRALLIGYSQGADVLPFAINRLPAATRRRVALAALLGLDERADFEFHLSSWVLNGDSGLPVRPEILKLAVPTALCIYGDDDADSLCPHLHDTRVKIVKLAGGHHFNGDYDAVAQAVVEAAAPRVRAN